MNWVFYLVLIVFFVIDICLDKKLLSPVKIFNLIWLVIYSLYLLNLSYIQQPLSNKTIFIFIICVLFYNLACLFAKFLFKKKKKSQKEIINIVDERKLKKKLDFINIIFILIFIIEIIYSKGFPLLFRLQGGDSQYLNFGITSVHGLLNGLAVCMGAYYLFKKDKRKYIYLIFGILTISRQVLMSLIIEAIIYFLCIKINKKMDYKKIALGMCGLVVLVFAGFTLIGNFRSGSDMMENIFRSKEQYRNLPTGIMWVYSYTEFSLSNFNNLVSMTPGAVNHGASTLSFFLPSIITNHFNIHENFSENYLVSPNFTASTWFPEIYLDFGIIGIALFSSLIGLLGGFLYRKVINVNSDMYNLLYAVFIHNILLFFFVNFFIYISMAVQFILIPIIFGGDLVGKNSKKRFSKHNNTDI